MSLYICCLENLVLNVRCEVPISFCKYIEVNYCSYMQQTYSYTESATFIVAIDAFDVFENLFCNFGFVFFFFRQGGERDWRDQSCTKWAQGR